MEIAFKAHLHFTSVPPQPDTTFLLTLILWTSGANRNTKSSTVAMELWNIFLRLFSSSSLELLWQGSPGEPWFSIWWIKALLLPPQLDPRSVPTNRSLLQSWGASRSIQWRVCRSFVSATPSLSWWPAWDTHRVRLRQTLCPEQWLSVWGLEDTLALLWETLAFLCAPYNHCWKGTFILGACNRLQSLQNDMLSKEGKIHASHLLSQIPNTVDPWRTWVGLQQSI